jgi:NitT/TauT family transport system ATP-binding protein
VTIILVTHSIQEAIFLGHHVMVMSSFPSSIREIVNTGQVEDLASATSTDLSTHLQSLLVHQKAIQEHVALVNAVE